MSKTEPETSSNDPVRSIYAAILLLAVEDAKRIGGSRAKYLAAGREIPKKAVRTWSAVRALVSYVHSDDFERQVLALDQDDDLFRHRLLQILAGCEEIGKIEETRTCPNCKQSRILATEFGVRVINGKEYRQSWCKFCRRG